MAVRLPQYPFGLGSNPAYLYLMSAFDEGQQEHSPRTFAKLFDRNYVSALEQHEIIYREGSNNGDVFKLGFHVDGSTAALILDHVEKEIRSFTELIDLLPENSRAVSLVKNTIVFLHNFCQVEAFTLPLSAQTCIARENDTTAGVIDEICSLTEMMPPELVFALNMYERSPEFDDALRVYEVNNIHRIQLQINAEQKATQ